MITKPLLSVVIDFTLSISGYQLAFNDFILGFFLTIPGMIAALLFVFISAIFIYFEFSVIILLAYYYRQKQYILLIHTMEKAISCLKSLRNPGIFGFAVYALGLLPLANIGISPTLFPQWGIPKFVSGELAKSPWGPYLLGAFALLVFVLFFCTIFVLPIMVLEGKSFGKALKMNFKLLRYSGKKLVGVYGGFFLLWIAIFLLPRLVMPQFLTGPNMDIVGIYRMYGFSWQTLVLGLLLIAASCIQLFLMPVLLSFVTHKCLDATPKEEISPRLVLAGGACAEKPKGVRDYIENVRHVWQRVKQNKLFEKTRSILAAILVFLGGYLVFSVFHTPPGLHEPIVIGHRGSAYGVENTLGSIQGAIDAKAEYVEVDVLLSSDGVPMVVHDSNLERLAGTNSNVYDQTAQELTALTLSQNGYEGRLSTLEEVIQYCRGKINLAIELKVHGHEQKNLIDQVMSVVESNQFADNCIFLSLEYSLVAEINEKYPPVTAGYCVYGSVGALDLTLMTMNIDFVVIEESMATRGVISDFRKSWLPVYVWTVNEAGSMKTYLEIGAIGLVTDYPDVAREAVDAYNQTSGAVYLDEAEWKE